MTKTITVFGSTGLQGGSVIKVILADPALSKEFTIRGVTRDTSKPNAQALAKQGVELVTADLNSKDSVISAIKGSDTVFLVTNYWETADPAVEKKQGHIVADAAKEVGVKHIIFSSLVNVTKVTDGRLKHVLHFDGKAEIEDYIRSTGVPATFVLPGYYMDNYQKMLRKADDGSYTLAYPVNKDSKFPLLDTASDFGKFVTPALKNPKAFAGRQIFAAYDYYDIPRIVKEFEEVVGAKLNFQQITPEQYKSFLPPSVANEYLENHLLIENPGYYNGASLKESVDACDQKLTSWKEYLKNTKFGQ